MNRLPRADDFHIASFLKGKEAATTASLRLVAKIEPSLSAPTSSPLYYEEEPRPRIPLIAWVGGFLLMLATQGTLVYASHVYDREMVYLGKLFASLLIPSRLLG